MSHFHCVKGVRIQSYSGPHFSHIFPHLDWIRKDTQIIQKIILNSIKRTVKFSIFNLYYGFLVTASRSMMDYHCLFQCGVNDNSTEAISTERWKQLETKTKHVFESTDWEKTAERLNIHKRFYITLWSKRSLQQSRKKKEQKMLKKPQKSLKTKICRTKNVNHHHLNWRD